MPKKVRRSVFLDFFGYFWDFSPDPQKDPFWDFFAISGPEGPETLVDKKMAWGKFSLAGESHKFSLKAKKLLFPKPFISWENSPFRGKGKAIFKGNNPSERKFSLWGKIGPIIPQREKFAPKDV